MWTSCVPSLVGGTSPIDTKKRPKSTPTIPKTRLRKGSSNASAYHSLMTEQQNENSKQDNKNDRFRIRKNLSWGSSNRPETSSNAEKFRSPTNSGARISNGFLDRAFENASFIEFDDENQE